MREYEFLSKRAVEIHKKINGEEPVDFMEELGITIDESGTHLPGRFCIVSTLNDYQDFRKLSEQEYKLLMDFAAWLEMYLGVCDGGKSVVKVNGSDENA